VYDLIYTLSANVEGNATNFYIYKRLKNSSVKLAKIARGFTVGDDPEFADQIILGRCITQGVVFENSLKRD
jgi:recombination protein RecR